MLDGVNILSKTVCNDSQGWFLSILCGILYAFVVFVVLGVLWIIIDKIFHIVGGSRLDYISLISTIMLVIVAWILGARFEYDNNQYKDYYKYKVTLEDTVNFNEFNKRYKILNQDGEIYTIIDKE